jgi:hypothetical protein
MRINGLYKVNFNEQTKTFTPERIECDYRICDAAEFRDNASAEGPTEWKEQMKDLIDAWHLSSASTKVFIEQWEKYASEEDKRWTVTELAQKLHCIKAGEWYFQFFAGYIMVDASRHFDYLIDRYGVKQAYHRNTPRYYWPARRFYAAEKERGVLDFDNDYSDGTMYISCYGDGTGGLLAPLEDIFQ